MPINPGVAQLVARLTGGQEAASSSLVTRTIKKAFRFMRKAFYYAIFWAFSPLLSFSKFVPFCPEKIYLIVYLFGKIYLFFGDVIHKTKRIFTRINYNILISLFAASTVSRGSPNEDNLK